MEYLAKFCHSNHRKFVQVAIPEEGHRPVGCTIFRRFISQEELPMHLLEWRGRAMNIPDSEGSNENNDNDE
jgi:hypothetical protein